MIVQADVKGLEVVCAAFLSRDAVLLQELRDGVDIHKANEIAFGLPSRLIAKVLKFRLIYGGGSYGFVNDPDFSGTSTKVKYWDEVIAKYYDKYQGIGEWHEEILQMVGETSELHMPTGRSYVWDLMRFGAFKVPAPEVKNYPVQGLGADVVSIARVSFYNRLMKSDLKSLLVNTVHDSIVMDCPAHEVEAISQLFYDVFRDLPKNINKIFDMDFDLETNVEILIGPNMGDLKEAV